MNELIMLQIGTSGQQGRGMNQSTLAVKGQGHIANVRPGGGTILNPFLWSN